MASLTFWHHLVVLPESLSLSHCLCTGTDSYVTAHHTRTVFALCNRRYDRTYTNRPRTVVRDAVSSVNSHTLPVSHLGAGAKVRIGPEKFMGWGVCVSTLSSNVTCRMDPAITRHMWDWTRLYLSGNIYRMEHVLHHQIQRNDLRSCRQSRRTSVRTQRRRAHESQIDIQTLYAQRPKQP